MAGAVAFLGYARGALAAARGAAAAPAFEPTIWYSIDSAGIVTVCSARAEMGQHIGTALARIVADELEADWSKVRVVTVDSAPRWGLMLTGASFSVWQDFPVYSRAGAAGRIALVEAGAKLLGIPAAACTAHEGAVHGRGKSISYGDLVARGGLRRTFTPEELKSLPLKTPGRRKLIGKDTIALDIPAKVDGSGRYGIDASVPGMVYARPKIPPTRYDSRVVALDDARARKIPGYLKTVVLDDPSGEVPGWVMVVAESFVAADRAANLVEVEWKSGPAAAVSEQDIQKRAAELIADPKGGALIVDDPGVDGALAAARHKLERTYTTATVMHYAMEPINALAFEKDGVFEVHAGNQFQSQAVALLSKALGRLPETIVLRSYLLGGGFGRRIDGDYVVPAALAAKAMKRPVKMVCTRADDMRFDCPRSPTTQVLRMAWDDAGKVTAMDHQAAAGWPTAALAPALLGKALNGASYDPFSIDGANHWYAVGAQRVRALENDLANRTFRPGYLRAVSACWTGWAVESFLDEAAHAQGIDPVAFRLRLLDGSGRNKGSTPDAVGGAQRQRAVLLRLAEKVGWGKPREKDVGLGIATTSGQAREMPTWVGCAARVRVDRSTGRVRLEKLTLVVDAGTIVHPDGAAAQVEGSALWGVSMALHEGTEFVKGEPRDTNLNTYTPLRIGDVPEIEVEFVPSTEAPVGLGEPGTTAIAPAIANAIFAATGARVRHLPIRPKAVLAALSQG
jgi:CO/xanthine dehydrogenase Mo-binding subunit